MIDKDYSFLLSRPEWTFEEEAIDEILAGKRVMITGAGGSIGSTLARRVANSAASFIGLVGHSELPIFNVLPVIRGQTKAEVDHRIQSVAEPEIAKTIDAWKPDIIFHAAAHKHVGLLESQPEAAFKNNTRATCLLAALARDAGVDRFVFISTDKAVRPTSFMGASKRLAEAWLLTEHKDYAHVCRFGNVLGSSGSVVEILERRKAAGEDFKLTDPNMKRYWITAREAAGLVLSSGLLFKPGLYALEMGEQVPLADIATKLAGPETKLEWSHAGGGEKIAEDLIGNAEYRKPTKHPGIFNVFQVPGIDQHNLNSAISGSLIWPERMKELAGAL